MMKIVFLTLVAAVVVLGCEHPTWSPDSQVLSATCPTSATAPACSTDAHCPHGQQCCFEVDGCGVKCYHPDHAIHTTHPHGGV